MNLKINRFLLLGHRKNYDLPEFKGGLNIIHGSTDTGKSMILRLIAYCLGKSNLKKKAPEIMDSCTHIILELSINNNVVTIKRDLHKSSAPIEIFYGDITNFKKSPDDLFHIRGTKKIRPISDFLMGKLEIPPLKVPYAPSDPEKGFSEVSIKDLINLIYLSDEEVGNSNFLGKSFPQKHIKYIESLKALILIDNPEIFSLISERQKKHKEMIDLKKYTENIKRFLLENNLFYESQLKNPEREFKEEIFKFELKISEINESLKKDSNFSESLAEEILSKKENIFSLDESIGITREKIREFNELTRSYNESIKNKMQILSLKELEKENYFCPLCGNENPGNEERTKIDKNFVEEEIKDLKNKVLDLDRIIKENQSLVNSSIKRLEEEKIELQTLEDKHSQKMKYFLSPKLEERDGLLISLGQKRSKIELINERSKLLEDYNKKKQLYNKLKIDIKELDFQIESLKKEMKKKEEIINEISKYFKEFMEFIEQDSAEDPYIDDKFTPHIKIRDDDLSYYSVPGTAKKVVMGVAYYTALLKYSLNNKTFLPRFLMIDSPSTGRGNNPEDPSEDIDIKVYKKMFEYWKEIVNENNKAQIIIVDHTLPPESVKEDILVTFDRSGKEGARKALIDDL